MTDPHFMVRRARVLDGTGCGEQTLDVLVRGGRIAAIGPSLPARAAAEFDAEGMVLAPGFIDTHTHDDTSVIETPAMLPKLSQGVTTVIVGNCGISAAPVRLGGEPPDPMNLLGPAARFRYPAFAEYVAAVGGAHPAVNVAALVGHTALRSNHMNRLDRAATAEEVAGMRAELGDALAAGALGLSTGLAYASASQAPTEEVAALAGLLEPAGGLYATHLRTEAGGIRDAIEEALDIGRRGAVPVVISHLKCAGIDNWGRGAEVLRALEEAGLRQEVACDCYPYTASASTLDPGQVDPRVTVTITWSTPHPEAQGRSIAAIAREWAVSGQEAARRLRPAGAIYHCIGEEDMRQVLRHPLTMIGSDGLPLDPRPHPRLWGTFPRVLGLYSREQGLLPLQEAIRKMTGLPAERFRIRERGLVREGYFADLVLFDPEKVIDTATYDDPVRPARGILRVWVNGVLSYSAPGGPTGDRAGRFLPRTPARHRAVGRS